MNFYTSDLHFGHKNIIELESRPFSNIEQMDEYIIRTWNERISDNDNVYILGDFSFYKVSKTMEIIKRLNGKKHLIKGNHDNFLNKESFDTNLFESISDIKEVKDGDYNIVLCHYPIQVWNGQHHGYLHFYGHVHSNMGTCHPMKYDIPNSYNVGLDVRNYKPVTLSEILMRDINPMNNFEIYPHIVYATAFLKNGKLVDYSIGSHIKDWGTRTFRGFPWERATMEEESSCRYNQILVNNIDEHNESFDILDKWLVDNFEAHEKTPDIKSRWK